jgi:photosystem II stability/assembly factor-like uncharacterized protein
MRSRSRLSRSLPLSTLASLAGIVLLSLAGPSAAQVGVWKPLGPEGGTVNVFAVAPADPHVVYAGLKGGGVFRSADDGRSWNAANGGLGNFFVGALAVDPHNPSVAYAGTEGGFYKTVTAGAAWVRFGPGLDPSQPRITALAVDPSIPSRIYAGTLAGLYISTNGGRRFALAGGGLPAKAYVSALVAEGSGTVLVGTSAPLGLFKSTDGGATWSDKTAGLHAERLSLFEHLVEDPSSPDIFYASFESGLFRSLDDGETFAPLASAPHATVASLAVSPSGTLYEGTVDHGVFKSADQGASFQRVAQSAPGAISPAFIATAVAAVPDGPLLTGALGRGVLRLETGTRLWRDSSRGLLASTIEDLALDPRATGTLYAGVLGRGLEKSLDGGVSWHDSSTGLAAVGTTLTAASVAVDPLHPDRVYAGVEKGGLAMSGDGGAHFSKVVDFSDLSGLGLCNSPTRLTFAPSSSTLFIGIDFDFRLCNQYSLSLQTSNGGKSFQDLPGLSTLDALAFDPAQPSVVYAASMGDLFRSTDFGRTFPLVTKALEPQGIQSLLVDPGSSRKLYAGTYQAGVYRSGDRGVHWGPGGPLPTGEVPVLVAEPGTRRLFAGVHGHEVYVSADGGSTWQLLGEGLPPGTFEDSLMLDPQHHILYAGTSGSGVYKLELGGSGQR